MNDRWWRIGRRERRWLGMASLVWACAACGSEGNDRSEDDDRGGGMGGDDDVPPPIGSGGDAGVGGASTSVTGGGAAGNPCDGVTCDTPPPPACLNAYTRQAFSASGVCADGTCDYQPVEEICSHGCQAAACAPNPVWQQETSGTTRELTSVWGNSSGDVYAVANWANDGPGFVLHSTGDGNWTPQSLGEYAHPVAVWGCGPNDVYVVGSYAANKAALWHSTGDGNWTLLITYSNFSWLRGIFGTGCNDVYAVGDLGTIIHHDGVGWDKHDIGFGNNLSVVWGTSPGDIYVGGAASLWRIVIFGYYVGQDAGSLNFSPHGMWGSHSGDFYVVGTDGEMSHSTGNDDWSAQTSGTISDLHGIWGSGNNDIYIVGDNGWIAHSPGAGHWLPEPSGVTARLRSVWGSAANDVYVVGSQGTILHHQ